MNEEMIIAQMGLLLTQMRATRRAIEEIERSTARYTGGTFLQAAAAGASWGAPPLQNGALRVYVVNINDLAPTGGGFLEPLLGGIGRLLGGFLGGIVGGTASGVALPGMIANINAIAGRVERIMATVERFLDRLGIRAPRPAAATTPAAAVSAAQPPQTDWLAQVRGILPMVPALTGLFTAAATGPAAAAAAAGPAGTAAALGWLDTLRQVQTTLTTVGHLLDGLIVLVPILIGSLATVVTSLADIQVAVVDLLQFLLRNLLLLRGVVLLVLWDLIGMAARVGVEVLGIAQRALIPLLTALFNMAEQVVQAGALAIQFLGGALTRTINALVPWLLGTLATVLNTVGDTALVRVIVYLFGQLPLILPSLIMVLALWKDQPIADAARFIAGQSGNLATAATRTVATPTAGPTTAPTPMPDVGLLIADPGAVTTLTSGLRTAGQAFTRNVSEAVGVVRDVVRDVAAVANRQATEGGAAFGSRLAPLMEPLRARSAAFAAALAPPAAAAAAATPATGLEAIASAYERWLSGGGMNALLSGITAHFRATPLTGPSIPAAVAGAAAAPAPRATVQIGELVVEIAPPSEGAAAAAATTPVAAVVGASSPFELDEEWDELLYRGLRPGNGPEGRA